MSAPGGGYVPGRHAIEAYGAGGFRFAGMSHRGSILATPAGVRAVAALSLAEVDAETLQPLFDEMAAQPGAIEFLVIGTGKSSSSLALACASAFRALGFASKVWPP